MAGGTEEQRGAPGSESRLSTAALSPSTTRLLQRLPSWLTPASGPAKSRKRVGQFGSRGGRVPRFGHRIGAIRDPGCFPPAPGHGQVGGDGEGRNAESCGCGRGFGGRPRRIRPAARKLRSPLILNVCARPCRPSHEARHRPGRYRSSHRLRFWAWRNEWLAIPPPSRPKARLGAVFGSRRGRDLPQGKLAAFRTNPRSRRSCDLANSPWGLLPCRKTSQFGSGLSAG
jgi:hypothetical protein